MTRETLANISLQHRFAATAARCRVIPALATIIRPALDLLDSRHQSEIYGKFPECGKSFVNRHDWHRAVKRHRELSAGHEEPVDASRRRRADRFPQRRARKAPAARVRRCSGIRVSADLRRANDDDNDATTATTTLTTTLT